MADWITPSEASLMTGYNTEYIRTLIRDARIKAVKKGNAWWVDRASVLAYRRQAGKATDKRHGPRPKDMA